MFKKLAAVLALALALTGCSEAPKQWTAGDGPIKIVTSTNVWGSVANMVAGKHATVTAIISNTNQDPHSYEASARDQLLIEDADIVVMNGGGYDDFMEKLVEADDTPAILVNAYMASGDDETRNEHIWYDVDQVGDVAAVIAGAVEAVDASLFDEAFANVDVIRAELAKRKATLESMKSAGSCGKVFATEPLIDYLLEDAGCENVTPVAYSEAIEEERDVPPAVMEESRELVKSGLSFIAYNSSVQSSQIDELLAASPNDTPAYGFSELLPQDPDTFEYFGDYFMMLDNAITMVSGKF
jgi:zinc/manganese transport system substrate-binding protein